MSFIYVTGAPGTGKTTLQKEFDSRGYETRDIDNSNLGGPHNKSTGDRVTIPPVDQRTPEWFEAHEWRVYPHAFDVLKSEARERNIILFGVAASDGEILHVFDKIMYLNIDDTTLAGRIANREGNDFGKNDFELKDILNRKHTLDNKYSSLNVTHIDASKSLSEVSEEIISHIQ